MVTTEDRIKYHMKPNAKPLILKLPDWLQWPSVKSGLLASTSGIVWGSARIK